MTPGELLEALHVTIDSSRGIDTVRGLVIELATAGLLVPQQDDDEPASALLERALESAEERERPAQRKARKQHWIEPDGPLPLGWGWACCAMLGDTSPRNKAQDDSEVAFAPMPLIPTDYRSAVSLETRPWGEVKKGYTHFANGDIAVAKITPCFQNGKACVFKDLRNGIGAGTTELHVLRPYDRVVDPTYMLLLFRAPSFVAGGVATFSGTAGQQRVAAEYFRYRPIPLPPLAEQRRIVAKVDELMALLDELERARDERDARRAAFRDSALATLQNAEDGGAARAAWSRIAANLPECITDPADVAPLRQTILQLAVRGRLVPQDPEDEPATSLVESPLSSDVELSALPAGWCYTKLNDLGEVHGGSTPSKQKSVYWGGEVPWVTPKDMKRDVIAESIDTLTDTALSETTIRLVPPDSLIMVVRGMILSHSFPTARTAAPVTLNQDMKAVVLGDIRLLPYLHLATKGMKARFLQLVERSTHGTCKLKSGRLFEEPVPLPPLDEQHRIVAKVDELMAICDDLERRLTEARAHQSAFAAAAVHHLDLGASRASFERSNQGAIGTGVENG